MRTYTDAELATLTNASSDLQAGRDWWLVFLTNRAHTWAASVDVQARNRRDAEHLAIERAVRFLDRYDGDVQVESATYI